MTGDSQKLQPTVQSRSKRASMLCFDVCLVKKITVLLLRLPNIQTVQTRSFKLSDVARCRCGGNVKLV